MEDERKLPVGNRFFKVLVPGFEQALRLPPIISMILTDGEIPEAVVLVSRKGSWRIDVGKFENKGLKLNGKEWNSFVRCHVLTVGDFLVFEYTGDMHFHSLVFDSTTCEKDFADDKITDFNLSVKQDMSSSASNQQKIGTFEVKLKQYSIRNDYPCLYVPVTFMKSYYPIEEDAMVTLINPSGDTWNIQMKVYKHTKTRPQIRFVLYEGWKKFVRENKLKVGHVCGFELISHSSGGGSSSSNYNNNNNNYSIVMNVQFINF